LAKFLLFFLEWFILFSVLQYETFYDAAGHKCHDQTKFRATSFFVIDEVPLGTIVTLVLPLGFLSFVAIKKKAKTNQPK
jgi:hypothetical protein